MTNEEAINILKEHQEHWERLTREQICPRDEGIKTIESLQIAIKALEEKSQDNLISREELINTKPEFMNEKVVRDTKYRTTKDRIYAKAWNDCNSYWLNTIDNAPTITDHSRELVQKSIEIGRRVGYFEGKIENKRPHGKWITDRQPDKNGTYLCVFTINGSNVYFRNILSYTTDLYEVDHFDFQKYRYKKKTDRAGWYDLDSEYGYIHYEDDEVVAWMELPELPEQYKGEEE